MTKQTLNPGLQLSFIQDGHIAISPEHSKMSCLGFIFLYKFHDPRNIIVVYGVMEEDVWGGNCYILSTQSCLFCVDLISITTTITMTISL